MRTKYLGIDLIGPTLIDVALLGVALGIAGASLWLAFVEREPQWFGRSGSLVVLFAVIVEFRNVQLQQRLNDKAVESSGGIGGILAPSGQPPFRQVVIYVAHFIVMIGTIVWGYGDLIPIDR